MDIKSINRLRVPKGGQTSIRPDNDVWADETSNVAHSRTSAHEITMEKRSARFNIDIFKGATLMGATRRTDITSKGKRRWRRLQTFFAWYPRLSGGRFSFPRAVQNVGSELMNRNPPIMRLRLHWLRYDLVDPPLATPDRASPRSSLVSSMPYTCAPAVHMCSRKCHIHLMGTYVTPAWRTRPRSSETVDARQIIFPTCTRRCRSPAACNQRGSTIFLARKSVTRG